MPPEVVIIDYGMGNVGSILNMLKKTGASAAISSDIGTIEKAKKLILPGVGAFDNGMNNLIKLGLIPVLTQKVIAQKMPILGICLGLQLFTKNSEEGKLNGLDWLDAETIKFRFNPNTGRLKIPHMGWNDVSSVKKSSLFKDMPEPPRFYFLHSYHVKLNNTADALATTEYGYKFISAIEKENIIGVQFHPEKSHKFGVRLLKNFMELY